MKNIVFQFSHFIYLFEKLIDFGCISKMYTNCFAFITDMLLVFFNLFYNSEKKISKLLKVYHLLTNLFSLLTWRSLGQSNLTDYYTTL